MKIDRIQMIDMAINMLSQAKTSQQSIEKIVENNDISLIGFGDQKSTSNDSLWGKYIYSIIRGAVGLLEINTSDIQSLSKIGNFDSQNKDDEEDDYDE